MQEQPHVVYILAQLKNTLPAPSSTSTRRLPAYTTLILLHSLRGVFYPSNFIYPLTARFLLQRPEVDTGDVPMLYNMLYNSTEDWKKERAWIIRFLADGMTSTEDWRVFKRRHTWELLSSLFQSAENDSPLRLGILDVRFRATTIFAQMTNSRAAGSRKHHLHFTGCDISRSEVFPPDMDRDANAFGSPWRTSCLGEDITEHHSCDQTWQIGDGRGS